MRPKPIRWERCARNSRTGIEVSSPIDTRKTLRRLGQTKARLHVEDNAAWRFHTLADASVSADGAAMGVDEEGNKYIALTCAVANSQIGLDAGYSRPIAIAPRAGKYSSNLDLHDPNSALSTLHSALITSRA